MRRAGIGRRCPPALAEGAVHLWQLRAARDDERAVTAVLERYRREGDPPAVLVREQGRPRLEPGWGEGVRFSISRAGALLLLAVARGRQVGVDVEQLGRNRWLSLPGHVLDPAEQTALAELPPGARNDAFLRLWVRKEAVLKAAGTGLAVEPALVSVTGPEAPPGVLALPDTLGPPERFALVDLQLRRYAATIAVERPCSRVVVLGDPPLSRRVLTKSLRLRDLVLTTGS